MLWTVLEYILIVPEDGHYVVPNSLVSRWVYIYYIVYKLDCMKVNYIGILLHLFFHDMKNIYLDFILKD